QPVQAAVARELVGMVAGEAPAVGSDPERAVSPLDERLDAVAVERLRVPRVVVHEPYTVEAGEAAVGAQPEIAVPGLDEGGDRVLGQVLVRGPGVEAVLGQGFTGIEPLRAGGSGGQEERRQDREQ